MEYFPDDLLILILSYIIKIGKSRYYNEIDYNIPKEFILSLLLTCKRWNNILQQDRFWLNEILPMRLPGDAALHDLIKPIYHSTWFEEALYLLRSPFKYGHIFGIAHNFIFH